MPKELFDQEFKDIVDMQVSTYGVDAIREILLTIQNTCNDNIRVIETDVDMATAFSVAEIEYYKVLSNLMQITLDGLTRVEKITKGSE